MKRFSGWIFALCGALVLVGVFGGAAGARGETSNGNVLALYCTEAKTDAERNEIVKDAVGRPHFFRYLQIMEMTEGKRDGRDYVAITAFEPSSYMDVHFEITQANSIRTLKKDPESKVGDAIAVTGYVEKIDTSSITLGQTVVRHKDRLNPKRGNELLCEVDDTATFYSYTGGSRPVSLTYKDRDLLLQKETVLKKSGPNGWVEYLEKELAKRKQQRQAAEDAKR